MSTENYQCQASREAPSCVGCSELARRIIQETIENYSEVLKTGPLVEHTLHKVEAFVGGSFSTDLVISGQLSCPDRLKVVSETAVDITRAILES
jgi:hypothetical protein